MTRFTRTLRVAASAVVALSLAACSTSAADPAGSSAPPAEIKTIRLGFFPNLTHGPALVGLQDGLFKAALKPLGLTVTPTAFNAGPDAVSALFGGSLDITYIGPNPTINAYARVRAARPSGSSPARRPGGAALVVRPEITDAAGLKGKQDRHPAAGQHPGRRAAGLAQGPGPDLRRRRRRRRLDRAAGQRRGPGRLRRRADRRRLGARAVGRRSTSRPARRCWSTRRPCGRTASS